MQAQQRECAEPNSQGSLGGVQNSHPNSLGNRIPAFSSPLCGQAGSNEDDDDEEEEDEDEEENEVPTNALRSDQHDNQIYIKQEQMQQARSKSASMVNNSKQADPLYEEDVIDGFAIVSFATYEDLEVLEIISNNHSISFRCNFVLFIHCRLP